MKNKNLKYVEELLKYAILLYEDKDWHTAGFYAAAAFEACITAPKSGHDDCYSKRIDRTEGLNSSEKNVLTNCIGLRNKAIHEHLYIEHRDSYVNKLITNLCEILSFNRVAIQQSSDYEDIKSLQTKLVGNSSCEVFRGFKGLYSGFQDEDFRNLYEMRNKMYYLLAELHDFCKRLKPALQFDQISKTISAYVWLAAVRKLDCERPKIQYPSLSILATNVDVRVYLDFGGRCKKERKKYYKLLLSKEAIDIFKDLDGEFYLFDIYWYFNIENKVSLQTFYQNRFFVHKGHIEDEIKNLVDDFEKEIDSRKTIPDNKMLLGKIYSKEYVISRGYNFVDDIKDTYVKLLPIFNAIQA
jgi:hypothetical protein